MKSNKENPLKIMNKAVYYKCKLKYIIGYFGAHYMAFALDDLDNWHCMNDSIVKVHNILYLRISLTFSRFRFI